MATIVSAPGAAQAPAPGAEPAAPQLVIEPDGHWAPVRRLDVDRSERMVVTAADDGTARVWDAQSGELRSTLRPPIETERPSRLYAVAIHPNGRWVAVGGTTATATSAGVIYLFDAQTGRLVRRIDAQAGHLKRLAWSGNGGLLFGCFDGAHGIKAFTEDGTPAFAESFEGACYGIAVSRDGLVAATSREGHVHLYRVDGRRVLPWRVDRLPLGDPVSISFAPAGDRYVVGYFSRGVDGNRNERTDNATGRNNRPIVTISRVQDGTVERQIIGPDGLNGNLMTVQWSRDGRLIYAGGTAHRPGLRAPTLVIDAASGSIRAEIDTAQDSILDMVRLGPDAMLYSSFDGSWGRIGPGGAAASSQSPKSDLRGASQLRVAPDGMVVRWTFDAGRNPAFFDLTERRVGRGDRDGLAAPVVRRSLFEAAQTWEDQWGEVTVNNRAFALEPAEISRAVAFVPGSRDYVLGTSFGLRRLDPSGAARWHLRLSTETKAVNATADGRVIITGMADGTIRWWRASDARLLMSLFATRDGRWIVWTPGGYYDAGPGSESLVGWLVARGPDAASDFFSVSRFRQRFFRPDVIDKVLSSLDATLAVQQANQEALAQLPAGDPEPEAAPLRAEQRVELASLPPSLRAAAAPQFSPSADRLTLEFSVRASEPTADLHPEVRVDGRSLPNARIDLPAVADGESTGTIALELPSGVSLVQVLVHGRAGTSEPLSVSVPRGQEPSRSEPAGHTPPPDRRLFLVAIGVSKYADPKLNLGYAGKDAADFSAIMQQQVGRIFSDVMVRLLTDQQATRQGVLDALAWLEQSVRPSDVGIVFLAGHGMTDPVGRYFFLPHDGSPGRLKATGVSDVRFRQTLSSLPGKALLFIDTCYAGSVLDALLPKVMRSSTKIVNELSSPESGVIVFTSSTGRQLSIERPEWKNGAFTKAVVEGLHGKADVRRTGQVTYRTLDPFVARTVRELTQDFQTPVVIIPQKLPDLPLTSVAKQDS